VNGRSLRLGLTWVVSASIVDVTSNAWLGSSGARERGNSFTLAGDRRRLG
jgi:hypothetical protein